MQARGLRNQNNPTKAKLTYFQDKSLSLQLMYKGEDTWTDCFSVDATPEKPLKLPNVAYLGFSAETGELSDNFDIITIDARNVYSRLNAQRQRPESYQRGRGRKAAKKQGSWTWFFFKIIIFGLLCGGGYVAWTMYRAQKRTRF